MTNTTSVVNKASFTCTATSGKTITWNLLHQHSNSSVPNILPFQGEAQIWYNYNTTTDEYSEIIDMSPWIHDNYQEETHMVSLQCAVSRVCSQADERPCRTFTCRSNILPLPRKIYTDLAT